MGGLYKSILPTRMRIPIAPHTYMPRGMGQFAALGSVVLMAFAGSLHGQDFEGKTISQVTIRYRGAKTVNEELLRNQMTSKAGAPYRAENLDKDITSLYESGLVDDVRFLAEPVGDRVNLIAEVTTRSVVDGVGFVGNTVFTDQKLAKETKLKSGGVMSDAEVLEARRNIEKYYQGYGYPDVAVSHRLQPGKGLVLLAHQVRPLRVQPARHRPRCHPRLLPQQRLPPRDRQHPPRAGG